MNDFTIENICQLLTGLTGYSEKKIRKEGAAYSVDLFVERKRVTVAWKYELGEVFLDFWEDGICIYQDWFERLESDTAKSFVDYIDVVAKRFLLCHTRIKKIGFFFRNFQLQYFKDGKWLNVLGP